MKFNRMVALALIAPVAASGALVLSGTSASASTLPKAAPAAAPALTATVLTNAAQPQFLGDWAKAAGLGAVAAAAGKAGKAASDYVLAGAEEASSSSSSESSSSSSGTPAGNALFTGATNNLDSQFDAAN